MRNAIKHADATRIDVSLVSDGNTVRLEVRDDGAGFRPGRLEVLSGLGLVSMKERMRLVGGTIVIHSEPGRGTRAVAAVPVEQETA